MTENLAGRGEGLAGLREQLNRVELRSIQRAHPPEGEVSMDQPFECALCGAESTTPEVTHNVTCPILDMASELAALEAAAPPSTDGICPICYHSNAALATPSPQPYNSEQEFGKSGVGPLIGPNGSGSATGANLPAATQEQPVGSAPHFARCCESGNFGEPHVCCKAPGNLPTNIADLRERLFRLDRLLCDPHPGLMTWHEAYGKAVANVLLFWDNSSVPVGEQKQEEGV